MFFKKHLGIYKWSPAVCGFLLLAANAAAQLRICGRCGVEALGGETVCTDCRAPLPLPAAAEQPGPDPAAQPQPEQEPGGAADANVWAQLVKDDMQAARSLEAQQPQAALEYYRQCIGLLRVVPTEALPQAARDRVVEDTDRCRKTLEMGERACTACNGTGKRTVGGTKERTSRGPTGLKSTTTRSAVSTTCDRCRGSGRIDAPRTMEELRVLMGRGRTVFERQMHAQGRVNCGRGFIPPEAAELLTVRQQALLRSGFSIGCTECMGLGKMDCVACKGRAVFPCKGRYCEGGRVAGAAGTAPTVCTTCHGKGETLCATCHGNATMSCRA